jgi:hypothetical protein
MSIDKTASFQRRIYRCNVLSTDQHVDVLV